VGHQEAGKGGTAAENPARLCCDYFGFSVSFSLPDYSEQPQRQPSGREDCAARRGDVT
jgi:hypothetical protein